MKWPLIKLSSLGKVQTGFTPSTTVEKYWGGDIPFVTPADLDQNDPVLEVPRTLTQDGATATRLLSVDAVMVCCIGSLGKIGVAGKPLATNQQINSIEFNASLIFPRYGYYACQRLKPRLISMAPATTVAIVSKSKFESLEIPVPPLAEQRRIAAILDQADQLRVKRREALAELDRLTQSIFVEMFGDVVRNDKNLDTITLKDYFIFRTGKVDSNAATTDGEYPFFTCSRENYRIDKYAFDCEALLLAGNNASADYSVKYYKGKFNAYQRTYVITHQNVENSYEYSAYVLQYYLGELKRISKGSGTKYLTLEMLNRISIPNPPKDLQRQFASRLRHLNAIRQNYNLALSDLNSLFTSLQHRAFRGEL